MFQLVFGTYSVEVENGGLPEIYAEYARRATLNLEIDLESSEGTVAFFAVARNGGWPFLVAAFRYSPAGHGFHPGVVIIPETDVLFLGAGTLLRAFDLLAPRQIWEDVAEVGFWSWKRHDRTIMMAAELELAAWDLEGRKLWSTMVEPPWSYTAEGGLVTLDVMGDVSRFSLEQGPRST